MPPRYAYWTILIDQRPTAFRAKDKEELLPTFNQLQRKNSDVVMKWFARGRLWDTPEQADWSQRNAPKPGENRGRDWRPGGEHKDPRARFAKPKSPRPPFPPRRDATPAATTPRSPGAERPSGDRPWRPKGPPKPRSNSFGKPFGRPPFPPRRDATPAATTPRSPGAERPSGDRPWRPEGPPKPRSNSFGKPPGGPPDAGRPSGHRPFHGSGHGAKRPSGARPWRPKGAGPHRGPRKNRG